MRFEVVSVTDIRPEGFGDAPKTRPEETVHDEEDEEDEEQEGELLSEEEEDLPSAPNH